MEYDRKKADRLGESVLGCRFFYAFLEKEGAGLEEHRGWIHSVESMGLVDGPGIRAVVFLQGCRLRCRFCHNPDTWSQQGGEEMTPRQLVEKLRRFRPYFSRSGGGVTFSGGEPLMQPDFLRECLRLCRQEGIHTCLDTAGCGLGQYEDILALTDLVLYDVKENIPHRYRDLTGQDWEETGRFLQALRRTRVPVWVRHVVVPGRNDSEDHMRALRDFIRQQVPNVEKVELLPYHRLGENKYALLGIPYPLSGVPPMDKQRAEQLQEQFFGQWETGG